MILVKKEVSKFYFIREIFFIGDFDVELDNIGGFIERLFIKLRIVEVVIS